MQNVGRNDFSPLPMFQTICHKQLIRIIGTEIVYSILNKVSKPIIERKNNETD